MPRPRTRSRNRKRAGSLWRRVAGLRPWLGVIGRGIKRAVPAMLALVIASGIATGAAYGYTFITTSERFAVHEIEVRGNRSVSNERIIELMGVRPSDNIFRLSLERLAEVLEESEPMIARARVGRRLPATLTIEVEEREPAALVELDGLYLADADGRVFRRASIARGDGEGLPVITGLSREDYLKQPEYTGELIRRALHAVALYEEAGSARPALGSVDMHPRHGITFTTYEHAIAVRAGNGNTDALRASLRAFDTAWRALDPSERARVRIVYADERPDRVTIGFKKPN